MRKKQIICLLLAVIFIAGCLSGCAEKPKEKTTLRFADVGWDSILFHNAVAGTIAEVVFGYEWTEVSGSTPLTHEAVLNGDIDVHMEVWTDNLQNYDADIADGKLVELGTNFGDNIQGLYVPRYVIEGDAERGIEAVAPDLKTVEDLKNYSDIFVDPEDPSKGLIYGGITGWEVTEIMHNKYLYYGLDENYNFLEAGTDGAVSAAIVAAYDRGEPIVSYYWEPTWLMGMYDFILLEDAPYEEAAYFEGKTACPSVDVTICVSNDFYAADLEFCDFLSNYHTTSAQISEALAYMQETKANYVETAKWFLNEHPELVEAWLNADQAEDLYDAIG